MIKIWFLILTMMWSFNHKKSQVTVGSIAPDFKLIDEQNQIRTLSEYYGYNIVLYFFPRSFTPGWTKQACGFRNYYDVLKEYALVLGLSLFVGDTNEVDVVSRLLWQASQPRLDTWELLIDTYLS